MAELMYRIANEEAPDIRVMRPDISLRLANIVALSLGKRSETRYQDGDQFASDLRSVMAELSGAPPARIGSQSAGGATREAVAPSYDATQKMAAAEAPTFAKTDVINEPGDPPAFAKTDVIRRPGMPGAAGQGDGKNGLEA
jgi:eukaryotic-like serine/threonine-protein kinase